MAKDAYSFPTRKRSRVGPKFIQRSRGESSEQKAIWHNVTGAGRSHVVREFFGLTDEEQETAKTTLEDVLERRIQALGS